MLESQAFEIVGVFVIMKVMKSIIPEWLLSKTFGEKTFKVSIDAGFDCPNRDGTVAHGGCTFLYGFRFWRCHRGTGCPIREQFYKEIDFIPQVARCSEVLGLFPKLYQHPWKGGSDSRTLQIAINEPGGRESISERPDCLPDETIEYLAALSERMHVTVELGLQTTFESNLWPD